MWKLKIYIILRVELKIRLAYGFFFQTTYIQNFRWWSYDFLWMLICKLWLSIHIPYLFLFQCQVVLQGKSRNLIIRELQRTVSVRLWKSKIIWLHQICSIGISSIKMRQSHYCLIFFMGIPKPQKAINTLVLGTLVLGTCSCLQTQIKDRGGGQCQ